MRWWIRGSGPGNPIGQVGGGAVVIGLALVCAVLGARIAPHDPLRYDARSTLKGPSPAHLLGTDPLGRDVLSQVIAGARISMVVGLLSVLGGMVAGSAVGPAAGAGPRPRPPLLHRGVDAPPGFPPPPL